MCSGLKSCSVILVNIAGYSLNFNFNANIIQFISIPPSKNRCHLFLGPYYSITIFALSVPLFSLLTCLYLGFFRVGKSTLGVVTQLQFDA